MATLMVEITDDLQERLDREFASGRFKDRNDLIQVLLEAAIRMKWKEEVEDKIDEALDEIERGDFVVHQKGDCGKMAREYLKEERIEQLLLEAVDQLERGECAPWQPGEGRKILDEVVRRHK